ncbi:MAG TPA: 16S rRNA (adenine(1518)-N(6)/adenine(1519)-N(6))-dimethyltransferase RsmA, partial [Gemmatimonadaceae bacterium]|nr:16S rRNA (adenine(1518)-N(6)/adenine(1519)-N(6))-dimethyltransferase RsmA [Gemmatimonadaceae bacterium]
ADALRLTGSETVIEIGPGRGALTRLLAPRARRLIAVEVDRALVPLLHAEFADRPQVEIIEADVLERPLAALAGGPYVVAGNVPYYITTPILFHALELPRAERAVFLVQREVAERVVAPPGSRRYGALSVNVQSVARAEIVDHVSRGAFRPPPAVDSSILRLTPLAEPLVPPAEEAALRGLVQRVFTQRRKQMRRVLRGVEGLDVERADAALIAAGINAEVRPETLSPETFVRLLRALDAARRPPSGA